MNRELNKNTIFVQCQGHAGLIEAELPTEPTLEGMRSVLKKAGVAINEDTHIFIDEAEEPAGEMDKELFGHLKHGDRIHITKCRQIEVSVNYLDQTASRRFGPGKKLKAVKKWIVRKFNIDSVDAGEHVLQICGGTTQPAPDTPLSELVDSACCSVCLDFVPDKRVEG